MLIFILLFVDRLFCSVGLVVVGFELYHHHPHDCKTLDMPVNVSSTENGSFLLSNITHILRIISLGKTSNNIGRNVNRKFRF